MSLIFSIYGSFRGPIKLHRVAVRTLTWHAELENDLLDHKLTWKDDCIVVDVAQWLAAMWQWKIPNDNPRANFPKKYIEKDLAALPNPAGPCQICRPTIISRTLLNSPEKNI